MISSQLVSLNGDCSALEGGVLEDRMVDVGDKGEPGEVVEVGFTSYSAPSAASVEAGVGAMTSRFAAPVNEAVYVTIVEQ